MEKMNPAETDNRPCPVASNAWIGIFRESAVGSGDVAIVELCDLALTGNLKALGIVSRTIRDSLRTVSVRFGGA